MASLITNYCHQHHTSFPDMIMCLITSGRARLYAFHPLLSPPKSCFICLCCVNNKRFLFLWNKGVTLNFNLVYREEKSSETMKSTEVINKSTMPIQMPLRIMWQKEIVSKLKWRWDTWDYSIRRPRRWCRGVASKGVGTERREQRRKRVARATTTPWEGGNEQ